MNVVAGWKKSLGPDWDKTYAASNTIYVARQNNVIFSVLAQYFGPDAINDRLMLIETISFTTTPEDMLEFDDPDHRGPVGRRRVLRQLSSDGLRADGRRRTPSHHRRKMPSCGMSPVLPPLVPFGSHQWPMLITPGAGPGSLAQLPE